LSDKENDNSGACASPNAEKTTKNRPSLLTMDEPRFGKAAKKIEAIRPLVFLEKRTASDVESIATEIGKSSRTVYRWIKQYRDFGSPEGLLTPKSFGGKGKSRIDRQAEAVFQELFQEGYLSPQKLGIAAFYQQFSAVCHKHGIRKIPSYWSIYRRIKAQDDRLITKERLGIEAFREKYEISNGSYIDNKFPLQTIMIDHTKLDIILRDDITGAVIGRPWLTIALDAYSRCVWGYYLGFQAPNADIVGLTIRMGCLRKDDLVGIFNLSEWPVFGMPFQIHTDNGKDFRSRLLERGCVANGINLVRRPVKRPQYGSYIERFFGTLNTKLMHTLPGTTFSNPAKKGKYDSQKNSLLTITQLERLLLEFIAKQYHNEVHGSLRTTPLKKWKEGLQTHHVIPQEPKDVERFRQDFLCFVEPDGQRAVERDGVHFKDLVYYAPELDLLSRYNRNKQKKYLVRYDPSDVRYLYLLDDNRNCYYKLHLKSRPPNPISLQEIESSRKSLRHQGSRQPNEDLVMETILRRKEYIEDLSRNKKAQRKVAADRRTLELRKRSSFDIAGQEENTSEPVNFRPEQVDVDSAKIIRLDEGGV